MTAVPQPIAELAACPRCHAPLALRPPAEPRCEACGATYGWDAGVPDLTPVPPPPGPVADRWALWEELQANGAAAYTADPASSLSVGERTDARLFAAFADLRGPILDVGCGPQAHPSYVPAEQLGSLVGIDPLRGEPERAFAFVRGLAEFLPFRDASFDRVLFATSLDHLLDPAGAVREARRVLRPGGRVVVWHGIFQTPTLPLLGRVRQAVTSRLQRERRDPAGRPVPEGAADHFHLAHPTNAEVEGWLAAAGLRVVDRAVLSEPSASLFLAAGA